MGLIINGKKRVTVRTGTLRQGIHFSGCYPSSPVELIIYQCLFDFFTPEVYKLRQLKATVGAGWPYTGAAKIR
jgi:hypothetical protein